MRILVFKGKSKYNVLRLAADEVIEGFEELGCEVDVHDTESDQDMVIGALREYDLVFSIQAIFFTSMVRVGETSIPLMQAIETSYIGWIFDDILSHYERVEQAHFDNTALLTIDKKGVEAAYSLFPNCRNVHFLPHGGFVSKTRNEKDIDILFPCSMGRKLKMEDFGIHEQIEYTMTEGVLKLIHKNPRISPRSAVLALLRESDIEESGDLLWAFSNVINYTSYVAEYECKERLLRILLENGISVIAVGSGFEELKAEYPKGLRVIRDADISEVVDLIARTKILINPLYPVLEEGFHERIFTALLNNAICVTPGSDFLEEQLGDRVQYIDLLNLERFSEQVKLLLDEFDDEKMVQKREDNYQWALRNHTWKERGKQIVEGFLNGTWM